MIQTQRLTLDILSDRDKNALIDIFKDPRVNQTYMVGDIDDGAAADRLFDTLKKLSAEGSRLVLGIYLDGDIIGMVNDTGIENGAIELGCVISPLQSGRGYATEAVSALIEKLFCDGYTEIIAGAFEENAVSRRVLEKCGLTRLDREEIIETLQILLLFGETVT